MRCSECGGNTQVIDTRVVQFGEDVVRRRRECLICGRRYNTYEYTLPYLAKHHPDIVVYKSTKKKMDKTTGQLEGQIGIEELLNMERA